MSWKDDFIAKHGEEAYAERLEQRKEWGQNLPDGEAQRSRDRREADPEKCRENGKEWRRNHPEKAIEHGRQLSRKGGKFDEKKQKYKQTGIPGERERIRMRDRHKWRQYKKIIAPDSQLHHQWIPETAKYIGLALVEKDLHIYGFIDVIEILSGKITLFTEKEICEQK